MKIHVSNLLFFILLSSTYLFGQNLLNGPECVSFDSLNNRYLVSNWNNGSIIAIDSSGNHSYFKQGLGHALGNCIAGNTFYVSLGTVILGLNLDNPNDTIMYLPITGTTQMDGMTVDDNNHLYVVASIQAKIYKVNLLNQTYSLFVSSGVSARPQDVIYDKNYNRLLICSWYDNSPIQAVSLNDSTLSNLVTTPMGNCDGLALDENGNYYFSSWATNSIHIYNTTFINPPDLFSSGHNGPSNLCFNSRDNIIAVPNFNSNSISLISIAPTSVGENNPALSEFKLLQNYPNPFNPKTTINYTITESGVVSIKVFNALGNEIKMLLNEEKQAGSYKIDWNAEGFASGIYFYSLTAGDFKETKKMILLK